MRLYNATAFLFPRHYSLRMFALSFGAVHVPLITYLVIEALRGEWDWPIFLALLVATIIGSALAIVGIGGMLAPVSEATRGMRALRDGQALPDIPVGGPDLAGELLESVAHASRSTIERLDELKGLATTDLLTGLLNRRGFVEAVEQGSGAGGTLALFDLNRLKLVNDRLGHAEGDRVLRALAERIRVRNRPGDSVGRWGGDEFVAFFKDASIEEARAIVGRAERSLRLRPIGKLDGRPIDVSVGYAALAAIEDGALEAAITAADREMYSHKSTMR